MTDVGRQRQHRLIDVDAGLMPQHDAAHGEGVPQVMDARSDVSSSVEPAELVT